MAISTNTIRKITIQGEGQASLDSLAKSVDAVTASEQRLAGASKNTATVTDIATKRTLSAADAYKRQTLVVVEGARAQDQLARAIKVADSALQQGRITATQHAERIGLLQQKYGQASLAATTFAAATSKMSSAMGVAQGVLGAFGISLGIAGAVALGKSIFNMTADLQEQADQILGAGGNVEALQALRGVFLQNGISQEGGDKILQRLTRTLGEAAEGSAKAQEAFKRLGLGARELGGLGGDAALPMVAEKLLQIQDASKRATIEVALFSRSGQQLESALGALSTPLDELIKRAKDLGIVIDKDMIQKADQAKDKMELSWMKLSVSLAPIVTNWVDGFTKFTTSINGSSTAMDELIRKVEIIAGTMAGAKLGGRYGPIGALGGGAIGFAATSYATRDEDKTRAWVTSENRRLLADPNTSPSARTRIEAELRADTAVANSRVGFTGLVAMPGLKDSPFLKSPAASNDNSTPAWAQTSEQISAAKTVFEKQQKDMLAAAKSAYAAELEMMFPEVQVTAGSGQSMRDQIAAADSAQGTKDWLAQTRSAALNVMGRSSDNPFGASGRTGLAAARGQVADDAAMAKGAIDTAAFNGGIDPQEAADARVALEQDTVDKLSAINQQFEDSKLALGQNTFESLADGMGAMFGKQSAAYKVAFGVEKAFQIARTTMALQAAIAQAAAAPWPTNIPAIANAIMLGGQIMSQIGSISAQGFANGVVGLNGAGTGTSDSIPAWLSKGESVVKATATPGNRNTLMAMNAGTNFDRAPANSNMRLTVVHDGSTAIRYERISDDHIRVIAKQESDVAVYEHGGKMLEREMANSNNRGAKAVSQLLGPKG